MGFQEHLNISNQLFCASSPSSSEIINNEDRSIEPDDKNGINIIHSIKEIITYTLESELEYYPTRKIVATERFDINQEEGEDGADVYKQQHQANLDYLRGNEYIKKLDKPFIIEVMYQSTNNCMTYLIKEVEQHPDFTVYHRSFVFRVRIVSKKVENKNICPVM